MTLEKKLRKKTRKNRYNAFSGFKLINPEGLIAYALGGIRPTSAGEVGATFPRGALFFSRGDRLFFFPHRHFFPFVFAKKVFFYWGIPRFFFLHTICFCLPAAVSCLAEDFFEGSQGSDILKPSRSCYLRPSPTLRKNILLFAGKTDKS